MNTFGWLVKREYWENKGGFFWTPIWVSGVMLLLTVLGIIVAEGMASRVQVNGGIPWREISERMSAGDFVHAGTGLDVAFVALAGLLCVVLFFVLFFYLLGALYDDRRDRSVLFWKSLPVSDVSTVLSKVAAAVLLAPLIAFAVATVAYIALLVIISIWALLHGINPLPAIGASHTFGLFWRLLLTIPVDAMVALPTAGWLLFWSAYARSKPFLWAVLIPFFAFIANSWIGLMGLPSLSKEFMFQEVISRLLFGIMPGWWLDDGHGGRHLFKESFRGNDVLASFDPGVVYGILATPGIWIGAVAGIALITAAIWLRRTRIETST
jgi:ABC-2 type transport system permease protein